MKRIWIIAADSAVAHIYQAPSPQVPLTLLQTLEHRPLEHDHEGFAAQIAEALNDARRHQFVDEIWLVMPARMLGHVRGALTVATGRLVRGVVDRRWVDANEATSRAALSSWQPELQ